MGAGRKMSLADHVSREQKKAANRRGGSYAGKLRNWRSKEAQKATKSGDIVATVDVLFATNAPMIELAVHNFPKIVSKKGEKGDEKETQVFGVDNNCFEDLAVIEQQFDYDDAGRRKAPPIVCPLCRFSDWLRLEIEANRISWTDKAFKFKSDKGSLTLHAGGMLGQFSGWDLDDDDKEELKEAGINLRESFKENTTAKTKFVYCVVDLSDLDKGLQATSEAKSLGNQVGDTITERIDEFGAKGDPTENPYPFRWRFKPKEDPKNMYSVSPLSWDDIAESKKEQAIEIARGEKLPAVFEQLRKYPNVKQLRAQMEEACLLDDVPWDEIFGPVEELADEKGWVNDDEDKKRDSSATDFPHGAGANDASDGDEDDDEPLEVDCGGCGKPVAVDAKKCPHCGAEFEDEEEAPKAEAAKPEPPKPEPPPEAPKAGAVVDEARRQDKKSRRGGGRKKPEPVARDEDRKHAGDGGDTLPWEGED